MTTKEYQELKDRLWRDFIWAIPPICYCPNCEALLGFVTESDIRGFMVEMRLLEEYRYLEFQAFLQFLVDRKGAPNVNHDYSNSYSNSHSG